MAKNDEQHFMHLSLLGVFLIAVLTIFGMVALVGQGPVLPSANVHGQANLWSEFARSENVAGQVYGDTGELATHRYEDYDRHDRVVTFLNVQTRDSQEVTINARGVGSIRFGGQSYRFRVWDVNSSDSSIVVDFNGDGLIDRAVKQRGYFALILPGDLPLNFRYAGFFFEEKVAYIRDSEGEISIPLDTRNRGTIKIEGKIFRIIVPQRTIDNENPILLVDIDGDGSLDLRFRIGDRFPLILPEIDTEVKDTLREGETQTYSIDGVDYEVTLVYVTDPNSNGTAIVAKFAVNGAVSPDLRNNMYYEVIEGVYLSVTEILVNSREGVVSFILGPVGVGTSVHQAGYRYDGYDSADRQIDIEVLSSGDESKFNVPDAEGYVELTFDGRHMGTGIIGPGPKYLLMLDLDNDGVFETMLDEDDTFNFK